MKTLFDHVALSPYTGFVDNWVMMLLQLAHRRFLSSGTVLDIFSYLLRHLVRHLTAYDLVTFHNKGANYPDALLLDGLLKAYLGLIELYPEQFKAGTGAAPLECARRVRRRALRQAWLVRRQYEGHAVPDTPTSPGENLRVLPTPFARVSDEQLLQPHKRRKQLFNGDPIDQLMTAATSRVLKTSIADLDQPKELRELGMASCLDRPLGSLTELLAQYDFGALGALARETADWLFKAKTVLLIRTRELLDLFPSRARGAAFLSVAHHRIAC